MAISPPPQAMVAMAASSFPTKCSEVASFAFFLYDHAITFDAEVRYIWKAQLSLGKILFIWTRYLGLLSLILEITVLFHESLSDKFCHGFVWWEAVSMLVLNISVEVILLARVYAVYDFNRKIIYGLAGIRCCTAAATVALWVFYLPVGIGLPPVDGFTGCSSPTTSILFGFGFLPTMLDEVILCLCMLYRLWTAYRAEYGSPLLKQLAQDSILYFSSTFAVQLTNSLIFFLAPRLLVRTALAWEYAIPCAMGCRLLLSMYHHYGVGQHTSAHQGPQNTAHSLKDIYIEGFSTENVELATATVSEVG
ncbi:hypothetical protein JB92DRAFT_3064508 [Gautieria morchelliformis]|nr:hypothetical protein JB92DRAFT_3064508 [Gautieria morchelliformis]